MNLINFESDAAWEARFNEYLRSNGRAVDSLRALVDEGISESWLLHILHSYGDPHLRRQEQSSQRQSALSSLKEVDRALNALVKASGVLESFTNNCSVPDWVRDSHFNVRRDLFTNLKTYRAVLTDVKEELAKLASRKGEGVSETYLAGLVEAVTDITGTPHWGDLAYLVEASYFAHNRRFHADRDTIRKRFDRFVKNFPRIHESWLGLDWMGWFSLREKIEAPQSLDPHDQMDSFIRNFSKPTRPGIKRPQYGKIHNSMKR